jgi:diguanylate cyclase (GGDEF)-like protein
VLALSATLGIGASLLTVRWLAPLSGLAPTVHAQWWMLAGAFAATEVFAIHVDVRRDTYTISLMEIPLVIGLFLASPISVIVGRLVGSGAALVVHRRQRPLKVLFNVSLFAFETSVALVVFRALVNAPHSVGAGSWAAALVAVLTANAIGFLGVVTVIRLHRGPLTDWPRMLGAALVTPIANTCLALGAAALLWGQSDGVWLLGAIVAVQFAIYRAYSALSQRYANLQRLYEFTGAVQHVPAGSGASVAVLNAARNVLRATTAELVVLTNDGASATVSRVVDDGLELDRPTSVEALGVYWEQALIGGSSALATSSSRRWSSRSRPTAQPFVKDAIIVPIRQGDQIVGAMSVSQREGDVGTFDKSDLRLFETVVNHAAVALELARTVAQLEHDSLHDALTGLPNRTLFNIGVGEAMSRRKPDTKLAVLLIDLDRFKEINDTLGHHFGDLLLIEVGVRLSTLSADELTLARLGGDEFAVVLEGLCDDDDAREAATHIRDLLECPFDLKGLDVDVGASIGLALCPDHGEDPVTLLQRADVAMYAAKQSAGVEIYCSDRDHYSPRRLRMVGELRHAIESQVLQLHYQPKVEIATGAVIGVEALLRWPQEDGRFVPPDEFIPLAEHTGLIRPLTHYVLDHAIAQCHEWTAQGLSLQMSINVSARNLLDPELTRTVRDALAKHDVDASALVIEITESCIMADPNQAIAVLGELVGLGVGVSMDDFGTGYSSLAYLKRLPVTELKIDKSFVQGMDRDPQDAAIVRTVLDLGANLGLIVTAEGIETAEVWSELHQLGCTLGQGYFFSKPLPAGDLVTWLQSAEPSAPPIASGSSIARGKSRRLIAVNTA